MIIKNMSKKFNSEKKENKNRKFRSGKEIIYKLENLYLDSMKKVEIKKNDILPKSIRTLSTRITNTKGKPDLNGTNTQNKKPLFRYASNHSIVKKSPLMQSLSNEPPTNNVTLKYNSPTSKNMKSNVVSSSSRNQVISDEKADTEIKNSNKKRFFKIKKDNINNNEDDENFMNFNDISFYSNLSDNNNNIINKNKDINNCIKSENNLKKENSKHINNSNNDDNLMHFVKSESSLGSYKPDMMRFPHIKKDYYSSMLNNYQYKKREHLIQKSINFYLHQQKFLSKSSNFKKKDYNYDLIREKEKYFGEIKRVPAIIAFGKIVPKDSVKNKKGKKFLLLKPHTVLSHTKQTKNIFRNGLVDNNSLKKLKELKFIKDDYTTNNPNKEEYEPKDHFGNIVYPVFGQKKMLKNIMPKEYDYNTKRSPLELLNDTYHPLLRFQKKMLNQHINAINQEIGVTYSKPFTLVDKEKIPVKYQMCQDLIDLQKDEKLIKLIRELIDRNFGLEEEVEKTLDIQKKKEKNLRKKQIYRRFCEVMLKASIHFKRLNISLEDFYSLHEYIPTKSNGENSNDDIIDKDKRQKRLLMEKNGQHFFQAIRAEDTHEILRILNSNYFILFYRDNFLQSPLHISAKRNLYKFISLFISRGAEVNAKDEVGRTPLFIAAQKNNLEFVTMLLFEIADPSIKNINGEKPCDVTTNPKIKTILERAKALHLYHQVGKIQQFNESIRNGLKYLYLNDLDINCDIWIKENEEMIKECEK